MPTVIRDRASLSSPHGLEDRIAFDPLPLTRATALHRWTAGILAISSVQFLIVTIAGTVLPLSTGDGASLEPAILRVQIGALVLPLSLLLMTAGAERLLLGRPPKKLLAYQFGIYSLGTAIETAGLLRQTMTEVRSTGVTAIGDGLQTAAFFLVALWFAGTILVRRDTKS